MQVKKYRAKIAQQRFGALLKDAEDAPVIITRHGRRRYVLMSAQLFDVYEEIRLAQAEGRILAVMESALGKLLVDDEDASFKRVRLGNSMMKRFLDATEDGWIG